MHLSKTPSSPGPSQGPLPWGGFSEDNQTNMQTWPAFIYHIYRLQANAKILLLPRKDAKDSSQDPAEEADH